MCFKLYFDIRINKVFLRKYSSPSLCNEPFSCCCVVLCCDRFYCKYCCTNFGVTTETAAAADLTQCAAELHVLGKVNFLETNVKH